MAFYALLTDFFHRTHVYYYNDGSKEEGNYINNVPHGTFIYTRSNGTKKRKYDMGNLISEEWLQEGWRLQTESNSVPVSTPVTTYLKNYWQQEMNICVRVITGETAIGVIHVVQEKMYLE